MRPEKATIVQDLQEQLSGSPFLILVDYAGLNVPQFGELRNRLREVGAEMHVVKNTLLRRAGQEAGLGDLAEGLNGQTAMVTGEKDVSTAAKVLKTFKSEFQKPSMKLGVLDRAVLSFEQLESIAELPSREVLLAQLLGVLQAPATKLVRVLNEPGASLARVLKAKDDASGGAEAAPAEAAAAQ
jgi:large subunit ribosomal protein L10